MTPKEARHALADDIRAALPDGWTVYPGPPEGVNAPSVVLAPRSPYRVKSTVCNESVLLTATVLIQRNASADALDALDDASTTVRDAVHASDVMAVVEAVQDIGTMQEVGGVEYLAAVINIQAEV